MLLEKGRSIVGSETSYQSEDMGGKKIVTTYKPGDLVHCITSSSYVCSVSTQKTKNGEYILNPKVTAQEIAAFKNKEKELEQKIKDLGQAYYGSGCSSAGLAAFACQIYHATGKPYPISGQVPTKEERVLLGAGAALQVVGAGAVVANKIINRPAIVYRVDDTSYSPRILPDGTIPLVLNGKGQERALFINIGDVSRAQEFAIKNRNANATITSFKVSKDYRDWLSNISIYDKSNVAKLNPNAPLVVDINKAKHQYGLRTNSHIDSLRNAIIPGTVKIIPVNKPKDK